MARALRRRLDHGLVAPLLRKRSSPVWWPQSLACSSWLSTSRGCCTRAIPYRSRLRRRFLGSADDASLVSITGLLLPQVRFSTLGWGCLPRVRQVLSSRLVLVIVEWSGFFGSQAGFDFLDPRLLEPVLSPTFPPSGVRVVGCRARGPRPRLDLSGCSFGSNRAGHRRQPRPSANACFGKPSSEGAPDLATLWKTLHPGCFRFPRKAGAVQGSVAQVQQWRLRLQIIGDGMVRSVKLWLRPWRGCPVTSVAENQAHQARPGGD